MKKTLLYWVIFTVYLNATTFAVVNNEKVTIEDINAIIKSHEDIPAFSALSPREKELVLDQAIEQKLIIQHARKTNIPKQKDFIDSLEVIKNQLLKEFWFKQQFQNISVTQQEIQTYYNEHQANYQQEFMLKARHIIVKSKQKAQQLIKELQSTQKDVQKLFIELAQTNSIGPSASKGGDLGWFKKGQMLDTFWNKAKHLKEKSFTLTPLQTQYGYHIIYLDAKQQDKTLTLEEMYSTIEQEVQLQKFQHMISQQIQRLKKEAHIEVQYDNF